MPETKIPKVVQRMAEVMKKLPGLEKNKQAPEKAGGFAYRGIDDLLDTLHPLLIEAKLNIIPRVTGTFEVQFHEQRKVPYLATVLVEYEFQSAEDGSTKTVGPVLGTGADSLDKMAGKAMTSAFKNAMYQTFCVPVGDSSLDPETGAEDGPAGDIGDELAGQFTQPPPGKPPEQSKDDRHRHELHNIACDLSEGDVDVYTAYIKEWTAYTGKDKDGKPIERYCTKASDKYPSSGDFILQGTRLNIALQKAREAKQVATTSPKQQMDAMEGAANEQ